MFTTRATLTPTVRRALLPTPAEDRAPTQRVAVSQVGSATRIAAFTPVAVARVRPQRANRHGYNDPCTYLG